MELQTPKLALIREKRALLFPDNLIARPVLLSGPEPEPKMAANSTYREAKLLYYGLEEREMKGRTVLGLISRDLDVR